MYEISTRLRDATGPDDVTNNLDDGLNDLGGDGHLLKRIQDVTVVLGDGDIQGQGPVDNVHDTSTRLRDATGPGTVTENINAALNLLPGTGTLLERIQAIENDANATRMVLGGSGSILERSEAIQNAIDPDQDVTAGVQDALTRIGGIGGPLIPRIAFLQLTVQPGQNVTTGTGNVGNVLGGNGDLLNRSLELSGLVGATNPNNVTSDLAILNSINNFRIRNAAGTSALFRKIRVQNPITGLYTVVPNLNVPPSTGTPQDQFNWYQANGIGGTM